MLEMGEVAELAMAVAVVMNLPPHLRKTNKEYPRAYFCSTCAGVDHPKALTDGLSVETFRFSRAGGGLD